MRSCRGINRSLCHLTARQYGEVVLPDASTGQSPGTLARKLSRCKEGMAQFLPSWYKFYCVLARSRYNFDRSHEFIPGYKVGGGHWRSVAVKFVSEPEICQGILEFNCEQMCVSGCKNQYESVLGAGTKAKSVTNPLIIPSVLAHVIILRLS